MLRTYRFKVDPKNCFFCSDLHYDHGTPGWEKKLYEMRGFDSIEALNAFQIEQWNKACNEDSIVFLLGDSVFGDPDGSKFLNLFKSLRFKELWIMPGNHHSGFRQNYLSTLNAQFPGSVPIDGQPLFEVYPLALKLWEGKTIHFIPNYFEIPYKDFCLILKRLPLYKLYHLLNF